MKKKVSPDDDIQFVKTYRRRKGSDLSETKIAEKIHLMLKQEFQLDFFKQRVGTPTVYSFSRNGLFFGNNVTMFTNFIPETSYAYVQIAFYASAKNISIAKAMLERCCDILTGEGMRQKNL